MESCSTHIIFFSSSLTLSFQHSETTGIMRFPVSYSFSYPNIKIVSHHRSHSAIVYGPIFFSFKLKDPWKITPITLKFSNSKTLQKHFPHGWLALLISDKLMIAQEVSCSTIYFFFKIILASQNFMLFRHICHPKPSGQAYTTFSFITFSIWNAGSHTYLTEDTAADHLIRSNTILILSYLFLLRQFIYKTIFTLSNSPF